MLERQPEHDCRLGRETFVLRIFPRSLPTSHLSEFGEWDYLTVRDSTNLMERTRFRRTHYFVDRHKEPHQARLFGRHGGLKSSVLSSSYFCSSDDAISRSSRAASARDAGWICSFSVSAPPINHNSIIFCNLDFDITDLPDELLFPVC